MNYDLNSSLERSHSYPVRSLDSDSKNTTVSTDSSLSADMLEVKNEVGKLKDEFVKLRKTLVDSSVCENDTYTTTLDPNRCRRSRKRALIVDNESAEQALAQARQAFQSGNYNEGIDLYEQLAEMVPACSIQILAELYDQYKLMKGTGNRYTLYVSRDFEFNIQATDKVLDIGSGHDPFPFATHLADFAPDDDAYGRNGIACKQIDGKDFYACNIENMPFEDKEFDFVYCSHVLEHTDNPEKACSELMRVAKRGYIETPSRGKDLFLNTPRVSNHNWSVSNVNGKLIFDQYSEADKDGINNGILMDMHCAPQTEREKAFSALLWLKSLAVNTVLYWEDEFDFEVRRISSTTTP